MGRDNLAVDPVARAACHGGSIIEAVKARCAVKGRGAT